MAVMGISTTYAALSNRCQPRRISILWILVVGAWSPVLLITRSLHYEISHSNLVALLYLVFHVGLMSKEAPSQNLSGILSAGSGNLTNFQSVLLQNNDISGPPPKATGKIGKLQTLDLSNNHFRGVITYTHFIRPTEEPQVVPVVTLICIGTNTAALSTAVFNNGFSCGACYMHSPL